VQLQFEKNKALRRLVRPIGERIGISWLAERWVMNGRTWLNSIFVRLASS